MISAADLLREALRATEVKAWTKGALARTGSEKVVFTGWIDAAGAMDYDNTKPANGQSFVVSSRPPSAWRVVYEEIGCDDVVSCCAVGYIQYADVCMAPISAMTRGDLASLNNAAVCALEQAVWNTKGVSAKVVKLLNDDNPRWQAHEDDDGDGAMYDVESGPSMSMALSDNGYEGLVPYFNDHIAESLDEIRDAFRAAIVLAEAS